MNAVFIFRKHITPQQYPRGFSEINDVSPENVHCGDYRFDVDMRIRISLLTLYRQKTVRKFYKLGDRIVGAGHEDPYW
jgi:hypothetical protein